MSLGGSGVSIGGGDGFLGSLKKHKTHVSRATSPYWGWILVFLFCFNPPSAPHIFGWFSDLLLHSNVLVG